MGTVTPGSGTINKVVATGVVDGCEPSISVSQCLGSSIMAAGIAGFLAYLCGTSLVHLREYTISTSSFMVLLAYTQYPFCQRLSKSLNPFILFL